MLVLLPIDVLFKSLFVKNPDLLKKLVSLFLNIKFESIEQWRYIFWLVAVSNGASATTERFLAFKTLIIICLGLLANV